MKIYLPQPKDEPERNYIGMILGPRGMTQKELEQSTGCKICIRGKGASQHKRIQVDDDEDLHVHISGDNDANVKHSVKNENPQRGFCFS